MKRSHEDLTGKTLGDYDIQRELGKGGMGIVYKAHDTVLRRSVALKLLPEWLAGDEDFVDRFLREARTAAQINHPRVVTIHAVGQAGGRHFIAMEYVRGVTVDQLIKKHGKLDLRRAMEIVSQAAEGLEAAHKRKVWHRDIKPQNLMVTEDGGVKVLDFGIARMHDGLTPAQSAEAWAGTPSYMSPEQAQGKETDHLTDIYSLGIVLFQMLTGQVPFKAESALGLIQQIVKEPLPFVRRFNPSVPYSVVRFLEKACAKKAKERFPTAAAMKAEADRILVESLEGGEPPDPELDPASNPALRFDFRQREAKGGRGSDPATPEARRPAAPAPSAAPPVWIPPSPAHPSGLGRLRTALLAAAALALGGGAWWWFGAEREEIRRFAGHSEDVFAATFAGDGAKVVTGGADNTVRLWDAAGPPLPRTFRNLLGPPRGALLEVFEGHENYVFSAALSPDGALLMSAGADGTVRAWDPVSGKEKRSIRLGEDPVKAAMFVPGSSRLVLAASGTLLRVLDLSTGEKLRRMEGHRGKILALAAFGGGHKALSGGADAAILLWNLDSGEPVRRFQGPKGGVSALGAAPAGDHFMSGGVNGEAALWNPNSDKPVLVLAGHQGEISAVAVAPGGKTGLSAGWDGTLRLWDLSSGGELHRFRAGKSYIFAAGFSPRGEIVSAGADGLARIWRPPAALRAAIGGKPAGAVKGGRENPEKKAGKARGGATGKDQGKS